MQVCFEAPKATLIYIFSINDADHQDCLKIGETSLDDDNVDVLSLRPNSAILNAAARKRIDQYTRTAAIRYNLLHTESALYAKGRTLGYFNDKEVHNVLLRSGIKRKKFKGISSHGTEWFQTDLATACKAIKAVKEGRPALDSQEIEPDQVRIQFRPEQEEAIKKTIKRFKYGHKMLWNAKMRFGKTLSALQVIKELNAPRTLILTHRPVVDSSWFEDFHKIFQDKRYYYGSKNKGQSFEYLERRFSLNKSHYVYFASMQDLRGSETVGGKFDKNNAIFSTQWDLVIVDEAHEGTQTRLGQSVIDEVITKNKTKLLELSGTPFNLLDNYKEEEIYTWDYVMEQRAKEEWDKNHFGDPNPYACLPKLNIYTYNLGKLLAKYADDEIAFNFREFFRVRDNGLFVHEHDIISFLNLLTQKDDTSQYPFSCDKFRAIFRHTLWVVPGVKAAKALSNLLQSHPVFSYFKIVNVAGEGDDNEENGNALSMVEEAIGDNPDVTRTITLSCGRLTTGVSVPAWTGVLMLAGSFNTKASGYMQTIFRVQTPATINGRIKENCYVFDFAPDRTLQVLSTVPKVSTKAGKTTESQKQALGEFLNFCPVISVSGSQMEPMNVTKMLQQLKKAYVERVVRNGFEDSCLYNDELLKLTDIEIGEFQELKGIIGATKAIGNSGNIDINNQGLTNEEYEEKEELERKPKKELSEEEKARLEELKKKKKVKQDAISILRGISIRMPLLIYGADIKNEDEELTIDNFTSLVDSQSWEEFMPRGVTKQKFNAFKKYYDPEIFAAAGKRIRAMARAADNLTVEERISRITTIFATFRNPDKETVLTPWRVVNMHMGNTLGGYNFYDEEYEEVIEEPRYINLNDITKNVFSSNSRLLEINSKSGLYPLSLAYNIYRTRLKERVFPAETLEEHQAEWDKVVAENIFIICKTPMAAAITRRTLMGFRPGRINTHHFEDLINQIKNKATKFASKVRRGRSFWKANNDDDMKFNAIVGNPPYQINDGSGAAADSAVPVYHYFVNTTKLINPRYISIIMPSKWMVGGRGLKGFRKEMIEEHRIQIFYDYEDSGECFKGQNIDGGICYFLWNSLYTGNINYHYKPENGPILFSNRKLHDNNGIVIRDIRREKLIAKVRNTRTFTSIVSSTKPYGIRNYLFNSPERYPDSGYSKTPFEGAISIWGVEGIKGGAVRKIRYINRQTVTKNEDSIDSYKLFFTTSYSTNAIIPPDIIKADQNTVCTETFLLIGPFNTKEERDNCYLFMHTNFFRLLLFFGKGTMHVNKDVFSLIPLLDFTRKYSDNDLASIFSLDEDDILYINSHFK